MPVSRPLPYVDRPTNWFNELRRYPFPLLFDSGDSTAARGRYDILCADPTAMVAEKGGVLQITDATGTRLVKLPLERVLRELLSDFGPQAGTIDGNWPFCGGIAGYIGYDYGRLREGLPPRTNGDYAAPELSIGAYRWAIVIDHAARSAALISHNEKPSTTENEILQQLASPTPVKASAPTKFRLLSPWTSNLTKADYAAAFRRAIDYIRAGDCYQVNLAQRFSSRYEGDPWSAFLCLRERLRAPYSVYLEGPDWSVLSFSPESFLDIAGHHVRTSPIKGTRPRGRSAADDDLLRRQLANSVKDRAENLMIVDLLRNDLGKTCRPGSIRVDSLWNIETFPNVHHLVSTISGVINDKHDAVDTLFACFPGGSITGAPKHRAMQIIDELEPNARGVYCGSLFYLGTNGRLSSNIAIRTLLCERQRIHCWAGGGIVADSSEDDEYRECDTKVSAILNGLDSNQ